MAARAYWKGQIRLALVSIPVEIYSATKSGAQIAFNQIYEPTGQRIKYEKVVPGVGPVDRDEIVKGYEVSKGHYVLLDPEEIESVKLESRKTLDLVQFVDDDGIDPMYFEKPYYVVPADDLAEEAYVVLRDALRDAKKIGVGQLAMRGQEYVVAIKPCGRGMLMETLRYADEVNKSSGFFRDIGDHKPDPDLLDMAATLIDRKVGEFDAVLDGIGGPMLAPLLEATARNGRGVVYGNSADAESTFRVESFYPKGLTILGFRVFTSVPPAQAVKDMATLADQAAAGTLSVKVQATAPLADALPLIADLYARKVTGKVVLTR